MGVVVSISLEKKSNFFVVRFTSSSSVSQQGLNNIVPRVVDDIIEPLCHSTIILRYVRISRKLKLKRKSVS